MIMPHEEKEELILSPVSTTATGDFAACMAMAARSYADIDSGFAARMKEAAVRAWDFLESNQPILFRNPEGIRTGGYGDWSDADERLWAAIELALTCGEPYRTVAEEKLAARDRHAAPLGWGDMRGYCAIEGLGLPGEAGQRCRRWVLREADKLLKRLNLYGISMTEQLHWGSNMDVANQGMMLMQAFTLTGEVKYRIAAEKQLHYLLGANPLSYCYVSGFGSQPMRRPHHRPSVAQGVCQPGMLSGGPCSGLADAVAKEHLQNMPAGKCFVDDHGSYSTNEICIYWNSPLIALVAALDK
jgi:endoglucanase